MDKKKFGIQEVVATGIGTALFGEPLTWKMGLGIAICVAAVVFMILKPGSSASSSPQ